MHAHNPQFKTEELVRVVEVVPSQRYVVEVTIATTATYGGSFRPVVRHVLEAVSPQATSYQCEFTLVYIDSVNFVIKKAIEKGEVVTR